MTSSYTTYVRFLAVGGGLALLYAVLAALATSQLPLPNALSSAILWVLFIPVGFWCHRHFTFTSRRPHRHGLWLYAAIQLLSIGIVSGLSQLLARGTFWPDVAIHLMSACLAATASYLINSLVVFPDHSAD
ncbi:GtrA family protein [Tabrizicola sp.]|uniref:GtrA family protein n=1 Tax=Tabrizicola sp. TaxID=2005166 RepID=UPI003F3BB2AB